MDLSIIKNAVKPIARSKAGIKLAQSSPRILVIGGVAGLVGAGVIACRQTTKLDKVVRDSQVRLLDARTKDIPENSRQSRKQLVAKAYLVNCMDIAKLYAPAVSLGALSAACILGGHQVLQKRHAALLGAYEILDRSYKEYRRRVIEAIGEDAERDIRYGAKEIDVTRTVTGKNGKTKEIAEKEIQYDPEALAKVSPYCRIFDDSSREWKEAPGYNLSYVIGVQNTANDQLKTRGHIFLNEVFDMLDIPRCDIGQRVGWKADGDGDGYVDFRVFDLSNDVKRAFVNGRENCIWLDFNVDGIISID